MRKSLDTVNHSSRDMDVLELVHGVMHAYRSRSVGLLNVTHMEGRVLGYIGRHPGSTQSDLVRHTGRDKAQLARLIKGLLVRGLLVSEVDAQDRRNLRLMLTAEGESSKRALVAQASELAKLAVTGLSKSEQQLLITLLQKVQQNFSLPE